MTCSRINDSKLRETEMDLGFITMAFSCLFHPVPISKHRSIMVRWFKHSWHLHSAHLRGPTAAAAVDQRPSRMDHLAARSCTHMPGPSKRGSMESHSRDVAKSIPLANREGSERKVSACVHRQVCLFHPGRPPGEPKPRQRCESSAGSPVAAEESPGVGGGRSAGRFHSEHVFGVGRVKTIRRPISHGGEHNSSFFP